MGAFRRRTLWWLWLTGTLVWLPWKAAQIGLYRAKELPGIEQLPGLPPDHMHLAMSELPGPVLLDAVGDLLLPPLIILLVGVMPGWAWRAWRST